MADTTKSLTLLIRFGPAGEVWERTYHVGTRAQAVNDLLQRAAYEIDLGEIGTEYVDAIWEDEPWEVRSSQS